MDSLGELPGAPGAAAELPQDPPGLELGGADIIPADAPAAGAAELREVAGNRPNLLAELAGLWLGAAEGKVPRGA